MAAEESVRRSTVRRGRAYTAHAQNLNDAFTECRKLAMLLQRREPPNVRSIKLYILYIYILYTILNGPQGILVFFLFLCLYE